MVIRHFDQEPLNPLEGIYDFCHVALLESFDHRAFEVDSNVAEVFNDFVPVVQDDFIFDSGGVSPCQLVQQTYI